MAKVLSLLCLSMELSASMNAEGYTQNKTTLPNALPEATTFSKGLFVTNGGGISNQSQTNTDFLEFSNSVQHTVAGQQSTCHINSPPYITVRKVRQSLSYSSGYEIQRASYTTGKKHL